MTGRLSFNPVSVLHSMMNSAPVSAKHSTCLSDFYRCADIPVPTLTGSFPPTSGFFRFGPDVVCYGQADGETRSRVGDALYDASLHVRSNGRRLLLPFDPTQVSNNLRYESYVAPSNRLVEKTWIKDIYYRLRPLMPVSFRKHLQGIYLRNWEGITFPNWPLDRSVDILHERLLHMAMMAAQIDRLPFIWFWPEGKSACAVMTHDVETTAGRDFCDRTMDFDDEFGIKGSFQVVPEKRYTVPESYLAAIRSRGFEINVQGLDHDGNLFRDRAVFKDSARKINEYAKRFDATGFRSPILYRKADWFQDMIFSYDMSFPNVARLEAQRGGCCTVMPYSLPGGVTEIPVTVTEDYTLFHILKDYSTTLWDRQIAMILAGHGVINFIIHPDYITAGREQDLFRRVLEKLSRLRSDKNIWIPLPRDVDRWWRQRNEMTLVRDGHGWKIKGAGSERARIAYACIDGDRLAYEFDTIR